ncbi:PREDICTED: uncharacterized protein LOC109353826 [Lupinus angustifolius]|uniref:uncharacterized protein LOC109353826 n=1 Tax=Lupinus angustifolius TaxID=3871 RepID=UPI00092F7718|nr:PREDICTED: uncharacterized protein LOC109353826 [Lupinus angustifolius]
MSSSTLETTNTPLTTPISSMDKLIAHNVGSQLSIKLDIDNYPAWRLQFLSFLIGYDLLGYIDVSATVVTHLGTFKTSKQAKDTLKTMYASRSRIRIMALKQCITTFNKGTQPMAAYLQGIKAIVDELSIIDHPLDNTDLVIHTLNGLSSDYKEISTAL